MITVFYLNGLDNELHSMRFKANSPEEAIRKFAENARIELHFESAIGLINSYQFSDIKIVGISGQGLKIGIHNKAIYDEMVRKLFR